MCLDNSISLKVVGYAVGLKVAGCVRSGEAVFAAARLEPPPDARALPAAGGMGARDM